MKNATVSRAEGNSVCGDDIEIFLHIIDDKIAKISFSGNTSMITTAAASFWTELAIDMNIRDIFGLRYQFMLDNGFEVSPKRTRSAVIAILATRNAIHSYLQDNIIDTRDNVL